MDSPHDPAASSTAPAEARQVISDLVARFRANAHLYTGPAYNETRVRREFIDPLFEALGWDVANRTGACEAFKDVVHEDALKVAGSNRAPDYSFRMGSQRVFFVEAKKPAVSLKSDSSPAFQLRRYAWSANLPVSILTDFEELAVYDTRHKPDQKDDAAAARLMYLRYDQYPDQLDRLYSIFSKEAVRTGGLHRFAGDTRGKRGTTEVSAEFLKTISDWRDSLAREIALRNPGLADHELNHAVQATIDRILFLRIAEDRGIEPFGQLKGLCGRPGGTGVSPVGHDRDGHATLGLYPALCDLFRRADERYNAGLFDFSATGDQVCLGMQLNDKPLKAIIEGLYYPTCPYEFSVIPGDILGAVYEQFLGKVIRLTAGHRAKVEDKPEVRKAGGVYYTPRYIVDYIVEHTVGAALRGTGVSPVEHDRDGHATITILDPACGSGSFLLGAYEYLLSWHLQRYTGESRGTGVPPVQHDRDGHATQFLRGKNAPLVKLGPGDYRLSLAERRRILTECLFGVDIDPQAVEVTKLNLLLKCMEGENEQTLQPRLLGHERVLPNIDRNIKCGNSLIGWDYFAGQLVQDEAEIRRVRPFDWEAEFPQIFPVARPSRSCGEDGSMTETVMPQTGGFDCVIGNPPYIRIQNLREFSPEQPPYFKAHYRAAAKGNYDIYVVFVEKGLSLLNATGGLGMILPHKFFNAAYGEGLRGLISEGKHLEHVVHFGDQQVFAGATTYACLMFLRAAAQEACRFVQVRDLQEWRERQGGSSGTVVTDEVTGGDWNFVVEAGSALIARLRSTFPPLSCVLDRVAQGIRTSANEVYVLDTKADQGDTITAYSERLGSTVQIERAAVVHFLQGREIKAYRLLPSGKVAVNPYKVEDRRAALIPEPEMARRLPLALDYLRQNKPHLEGREKGRFRGPAWYCYGRQQNIDIGLLPKILVPDIADRPAFALDASGEYTFTSGYAVTLRPGVGESLRYVLGLLNSRPLWRVLTALSTPLQNGFFRYFRQFIEQLPFRPIDFSDPADVARHDRMVGLVQTMLDLNKRLPDAKTANDRDLISRQIAATDKQIDALVYELYGLTEDEIAIVEGAA